MNKTMSLLGLSVVMVAMLAVFAAAQVPCTDSDSGKDIWTAGITTDEKGPNADDCDGASHNLMEFFCDGDTAKHDNIKCDEQNAVCVTVGDKSVGDYCEECPAGYEVVNNECVEPCVGCECTNSCPDFCELNPTDPSCTGGVPEFSTMALGAAIVGVGLGLALLRKK